MSHAIEWSTNITVRQVIRYSVPQGLVLTFCIIMSFLKMYACVPSLFLGSIRKGSWKVSKMLVGIKSMKMRRWILGCKSKPTPYVWQCINCYETQRNCKKKKKKICFGLCLRRLCWRLGRAFWIPNLFKCIGCLCLAYDVLISPHL